MITTVLQEHVAENFAKWTQRVVRAIERHKREPDTEEARRKSGLQKGKHGLNNEEELARDERNKARRDYYWTLDLEKQLNAFKGKGGGASKGKGGGKQVRPKPWESMTWDERMWLQELWAGRLETAKLTAESKCHRVQARDFVVNDDDLIDG